MIHEDYITVEQAKELKKLGFPQYYKNARCVVTSQILSYLENPYDIDSSIILNKGDEFNYTYVSHISGEYINTPTISLVQKWLKQEKGIEIFPYRETSYVFGKISVSTNYTLQIIFTNVKGYSKNSTLGLFEVFDSPVDALSMGIDKCIEILKNIN